jgi:16S rRNA (cytosine967-C5)-methyltransferase
MIKFAVIGQGHIGKRHAEMIRRNPDSKLVAVCDVLSQKETKLEDIEEAYFTSYDELLAANLERLHLRASIAVGDAATYQATAFDAILIDAPCSATGTIRRHPDVAWTKKNRRS